MERRFLGALLVLLIGGSGLVFSLIPALAAERVRLGSTIKTHPLYNMPILAAEGGGFFKQEGVEAIFSPFGAAAAMDQATAAGQIDMGMASAGAAIIPITRGIDQIIVADLGGIDRWYVWVRSDSRLKAPRDLKGAKLAVTRFGSVAHAYSQLTVRALDLEKDVKLVSGGGVLEVLAALKTGAVDAMMMTFMSTAALKFKGEARELVNVDDYLPKERSDTVVVARGDFAKKNPETVKKVTRALLQGTNLVMRDRDWAVQKMKAEYGFSEELGKIVYKELVYPVKDGKIDRKVIENTRDFLVNYKLVSPEKTPAVEALYSPGFAH